MSVKTTFKEFKNFYEDTGYWGNKWHMDEVVVWQDTERDIDDLFCINGAKDDDILLISEGGVFSGDLDEKVICSFEAFFKRWRKLQKVRLLLVEIDNDKVEKIMQFVKEVGGKIINK